MSADSLKCSICGGVMRRVKVLPNSLASLVRYKCTCGHWQDLKDERAAHSQSGNEVLVLEGFQETM